MSTVVDNTGKVRVFVYGTLKRGHHNNGVIRHSGGEFVGYDTITGRHYLADIGGLPAMFDGDKERTIKGEIWAGDEDMLHAIDFLEGHPRWYKRRKVRSDVHDLRVWVYFMDGKGWEDVDPELVPEDIWLPTDDEKVKWQIK